MSRFYILLLCYFCGTAICLAQPTITSFTPTSGPIGTSVTITGTNFDPTSVNNIVFFGATQATVFSASAIELTVTVPVGATFQPITVLVNGLIAYSSAPFVVTFEGAGININSFDPKVDYITGSSPHLVSIGDLDGDGLPDLAVTNYNSNTVSVFRNTSPGAGTIGYAPKVDYTTGSAPLSVSIGDLDGDGLPDLAVTNYNSNTISVFRNTSPGAGTISYSTKVDFSTGTTPYSISIGDLDNDGLADLAVTNSNSNTVSVFRNTSPGAGTISYATKVDYATTGSEPWSVSIGDLDGDGLADLTVTNYFSNTVSVFRNTSPGAGTISYAAKVDYTTGSNPWSVSIGDLDGDGLADLAVTNYYGNTVSVFRNTSPGAGTISYATKVDYTTGSFPQSVSIGDLDGDGLVDLAVTNISDISVFRNTSPGAGTISYATKVDYTTGESPQSVSIGDLDGDGLADLAVTLSNTVSIFRNTPSYTDIIGFSFPEQTGAATIDAFSHTIDIEVAFGTDVTALISTFALSTGASAKVGTTSQVSGTTANDFTNPVIYTVTAQDGVTTQDWVVTVTIAPNTETTITTYNFPEQTGPATIGSGTIDIEVMYGTDLINLVATFSLSPGATAAVTAAPQTSGVTANDFTNPVIYTVTAEDGITAQVWVVTVTIAPNTETAITTFNFAEQTGPATIGSGTIDIEVTYGTDLTALVATFSLSPGATTAVTAAPQTSGVTANDFTNPVIYTVTAEDGITAQVWVVTVTIAPNTETDILTFSLPEQTGAATIDVVNHTIDIEVFFGTELTALIATFTLSTGASAKVGTTTQVSSTTVNDFTNAVTYTVTAEDGTTTQDWVITVTDAPNTETAFTTFTLPEQTGAATINAVNHTIDIEVTSGTDVTGLIATFTLSTGANAKVSTTPQVSGTTANDFTNAVTYTVTAEDGTSTQDWIVTVTTASNTATDILAFSFPEQTGPATVGSGNIDIDVAYSTDLTNLVATFDLSTGATASVTAASQTSGVTANDFTNPVIYTVTAEDGVTTQDWVITITIAPNTETDILTFSLPKQTGAATINFPNHTVAIKVVYSSDVTNLTPTITLSAGASVNPLSGSAQDFTSPVTYTVTAEDGDTKQDWVVTVYGDFSLVAYYPFNGNANDESGNGFDGDLTNAGGYFTSDRNGNIEAAYKFEGVTNESYIPISKTFEFTDQFTISVWIKDHTGPNDSQNFMSEESSDVNLWFLGVSNEELVFSINYFGEPISTVYANGVKFPYDQWFHSAVTYNSDSLSLYQDGNFISSLPITGTLPIITSMIPIIGGNNTSGNPATYDGSLDDIRIYNRVLSSTEISDIFISESSSITSFTIPNQWGNTSIDPINHQVSLTMGYETDLSSLIPQIGLPTGATIYPVSGIANDFTNPAIYTVTESGGATQEWIVNVSVDSLLIWYPFDDNELNVQGYGYDGVVNGTTPSNDRFGNPNSARQIGSNDKILIGNSGVELYGDFSTNTWLNFKQDQIQYENVLWGLNNFGNVNFDGNRFSYVIELGGIVYELSFSSTSSLQFDTWFMFTFIRRAENFEVYVNGNEVSLETIFKNIGTDSWVEINQSEFPALPASLGWTEITPVGYIDDFRIYTKALSVTEVLNLYIESGEFDPSLVAYYPFNGNASDESGHGNNGELIGGVTPTNDRLGNTNGALSFDGVDDWIRINNGSWENPNGVEIVGDYSLVLWLKRESDSGIIIHNLNNDLYGAFANYNIEGSSVSLDTGDGVNMTEGSIPINQWTMLAFTRDSTIIRMYVNGILTDTKETSLPPGPILWFGIGGADGPAFFNGQMDEFRIYDRAISDTEISDLFISESGPIAGGIITNFPDQITLPITDFSINMPDNSQVKNVKFLYRGITSGSVAAFIDYPDIDIENIGFRYTIGMNGSEDPLGVELKFVVEMKDGMTIETPSKIVNILYPDGLKFPENRILFSETNPSDYRIISIPLELVNNSSNTVFDELGENRNGWRLFGFTPSTSNNGGSFREQSTGGTTVQLGQGYFILGRFPAVVNTGEGMTPSIVTDAQPVTIPIKQGWNLIGNPYNFSISWPDILAANADLPEIDQLSASLKVWLGSYDNNQNYLLSFQGGFVFSNADMNIKIPYVRNTSLSGNQRTAGTKENLPDWEILLGLVSEASEVNTVAKLGMIKEASLSYDKYDLVAVPSLENTQTISFDHPEFFVPSFQWDYVPPSEYEMWEFTVEGIDEKSNMTLNWNYVTNEEDDKEIILFDPEIQKKIDMKRTGSYQFACSGSKKLRVYYGTEQEITTRLLPDLLSVGKAYPNPVSGFLRIPFTIPKNVSNVEVVIGIYDMAGRKVATVASDSYEPGFYEALWERKTDMGHRVIPGIYIYRMDARGYSSFNGKIVLK